MNLIEEYGSYKSAMDELKALESSNYAVDHAYAHELKNKMLEYRRQHNVYDIDDYVVYQGDSGLSGLFRIEKLTKTGKPKSVKSNRFGGFPCRYCEVRHATDAEIKAGHRL